MIREPSPPTGNSEIASWCRGLIQWVKQFQCHGVTGAGRKIQHPSGGYSIEILDQNSSTVSKREIRVCINGESDWFAKVAMDKPYKKDEEGKNYFPEPYPPEI